MHSVFKRTLAALLCLSILLSLGISTVFVSAEAADTSEYLPPVNVSKPLITSINCRDQVVFNNYNGTNYLYFSAGGTFYAFDVDKYTANPGAYEPVFSGASGINITRGMTVDSKGVVYVVGDASILMKYDPATKTLSQLPCDLTSTAWGLDVDEHDNVYIAGRPDMVVKYDPSTDSFTKLWSGDSNNQIRSLAYSNGYVYANRSGNYTMIKVNASTGELVKEAKIPVSTINYTSVAGNVVFGGNSDGSTYVALNTETMEPVDLGIEGPISGFVTKEHNGKSYFMACPASGQVLCSFDVATGKASVLEDITDTVVALRSRDAVLTLTIDGTTYENCLMTCYGSGAIPRCFNLDTATTTRWNDFTGNLTEAKTIQEIIAGPKGSNEIYVGGYQSPNVSVYNTSTKTATTLFSNGHDQTDSFSWYDGKLYAGCYNGAYIIQYDPATNTVKDLIGGLKNDFNQIRIHDLAAGDGKIFFNTIPGTGALGGCIGWYELSSGRAYVVPQEGHLYYSDNAGKTNKTWYNADGQQVDVASMTFSGVVNEQIINSLEYQNGLLYGTSSVSGGSNSVSTQSEAKLMVYDVTNTQKLGEYSLLQDIDGLTNAEGKLPYISGIAADPETEGKIWGVVAQTLFSFTYDAASKTMSIKEEVSFAKNGVSGKEGGRHWADRDILFDGSGYMYVGFGTSETGIQKIQVSDPTVHQRVMTGEYTEYVLGDDGNLYFINGKSLMMVALTAAAKVEQLINAIGTVTLESSEAITAARIAYSALSTEDKAKVTNLQTLEAAEAALAELVDPVVRVEQLINAIGTVTLESSEAITAARNAYNALSAEDQAKVTNLQTLEAAEAILAAITQSMTKVEADYSFVYLPPLEIPEGSSYIALDDTQITTLAEAYENRTINSAYIGKAEGAPDPNLTKSLLACTATYGKWLAFKLRSPGTGKYDITLNFAVNSKNTKECSVYILPGDTSLTDIETALASAQAVGTANLQRSALTAELGSYNFEADKDYVVVFKGTKDSNAGTTEGNAAHLRLKGLSMVAYVVDADQAAAKVAQAKIDAIGEVTLESENAITAARAAYDALTDAQKALVDTAALTAAEAKLAELKEAAAQAAADQAAADAVKAKIDAIGTVTLESEEAITAARAAYDALTETQKALVTNLQTLEAAEAALTELMNSMTKVEADYSFVYIPPLKFSEGSSYIALDDTQITTLAEAYENRIINSAYIGKAEGAPDPNLTQSLLACTATYGKWLAFKLRSPGTGKYDITLNFAVNSNNTKECSVYILPGDTSLTDIDSALTSAQAVGTANLRSSALTAEIGSYSFEAGKDYVVVFKATQDISGGTTADAKAHLRLKGLSMETYVVTADLEAAQPVQAKIDAIGEVALESEETIKAARAAYDALTEAQKALVDTTALTAAEAKLAELKEAAQAAADQAAADAVVAKIQAIGEVTLNSEAAITEAREAYEALTDAQKALIDTFALTEAEERLAQLKEAAAQAAADQAAADAVKAKIEAIGEVTLESGETIAAARAAYDALTADQKKLVDTTALTAAETKLTELKNAAEKAAADQAAADAVKTKIEAIGTVTLESGETIAAARAAYDALTADQKKLVDTTALTAAEAKLTELKNAAEKAAADQAAADAVKAKIDAIGTVTLESEKAIKAAREAYDSLTDAQKALVPNLSVLKAAESTLAELLTPETPQTGDMLPLPLLITLLVFSAAGLSLLVVLDFRRKHC